MIVPPRHSPRGGSSITCSWSFRNPRKRTRRVTFLVSSLSDGEIDSRQVGPSLHTSLHPFLHSNSSNEINQLQCAKL